MNYDDGRDEWRDMVMTMGKAQDGHASIPIIILHDSAIHDDEDDDDKESPDLNHEFHNTGHLQQSRHRNVT